MKKVLITVVGLAGYNKNKKQVNNPVEYYFKDKNKKAEKYNMLEFMIDEFGDRYEIIPIYTDEALKAQREVFKKAGKPEYIKIFEHELAQPIENESSADSYDEILKKIDNILDNFSNEDEIIIDITHGWRHLPILMIIDAIIHKVKHPSKIKKIYFAKEIEMYKNYEIIDITEYLELTLFVIMLNMFLENFTIADNFKFNIEEFEEVKNELRKFREYILSNSIKALIETSGVIDKIISDLSTLVKNNKKVEVFKESIDKIEKFLSDFKDNYYQNPLYLAHFNTAKMLFNKKYLLNAITFLIESQSLLSRAVLEKADIHVKRRFEIAEKKRGGTYKVLHTAKGFFSFIDNLSEFKNKYYYKNDKKVYLINKRFYEDIKEKCAKIIDIEEFHKILKETNDIRNSLAHIDMEHSQINIENKMKEVINSYESFLQKVEV